MRPLTASRLATVFVAVSVLAAVDARADGYLETRYRLPTLVSLTWQSASPVGRFRGYVNDVSLRGVQFELRFGVVRHASLGLSTSWSWFAQNHANHTVELGSATVNGPVYQRAQFVTVRPTAHWYLTDGPVQPYLGVAAGAAWYETQRLVADQTTKGSGFAVSAAPQLGILWSVGTGLALHVEAQYDYTRARFDGVVDPQWLTVQLGVAAY